MTIFLLLAAGSSSRMGKPKMLQLYNNKTLLQHIIDETAKINNAALLVLTGCHHNLLQKILERQQTAFVQHEQWQSGMGSSIQKGALHIMEQYPGAENIIILVCDQPHISSDLFQQMIKAKETTCKGIIACGYAGTAGTPVLFDKKYLSTLSILEGQHGAKQLLKQFEGDTSIISFPLGVVDIDTPDDYAKLTGIP
jgi:molybdenum cofactor cytidylyltransferase